MESSPKSLGPAAGRIAAAKAAVAEGDFDGAVAQMRGMAQDGGEDDRRQALDVLDTLLSAAELHAPGLLERSRLRAAAGDLVGAIQDAASAVAAEPRSADAYALLAEHMATAGRLDEATLFGFEALKAEPWDPARYTTLAGHLRKQKAYEAAEELLRTAGPLAPHDIGIVLARMDCLEHLGRVSEAADVGAAARQRFADDVRLLRALGGTLSAAGQGAQALDVFQYLLRVAPDDGYARHMAGALTGASPAKADSGYVRAVFDKIAPEFDDVMLNTLRYRGPALIARAVKHHAGSRVLRILDLGCGTGLCGLMLREVASYLKGIDISPGMAAIARGKEIYDEIDVADVTEALAADAGTYDVVTAGDTLAYFGALEALLHQVKAHLAPGGLFVFSVEGTSDAVPYRLTASGSFAHGREELRRLASVCGFEVRQMDDENLRLSGGKPVSGLVTTFKSA
ncbi:MAG TPA: methyltransferase domain-containing protein [Azospirillum sp.]|nr:methyltransferase domain-containing protein [Azospirillum sp.]